MHRNPPLATRPPRHTLLLAGLLTFGCTSTPSSPPSSQPGPSVASATPTSEGRDGESARTTESDLPAPIEKMLESFQGTGKPASARGALSYAVPSDERLLVEAEELVGRLLGALDQGDDEEAMKLFVTTVDLDELLSPGPRDVLRGTLPAKNREVVEALSLALDDKDLEHEWIPGRVARAASRSTFRQALPVMRGGQLIVDAAGASIQVVLDQLVYTRSGWKVFNATLR